MFQLADIARPMVAGQTIESARRQDFGLETFAQTNFLDEVIHQQRNVADTIAQRRNVDRHHIKRYSRSSRNVFCSTAKCRSTFEAAITRVSMGIDSELPIL